MSPADRMSRRTGILSADEIVAEALRQVDESSAELTIRQLAGGLGVSASAVYYHFASRAAIFSRAVDLVWVEATERLLSDMPDPFTAPPVEVLVQGALATRRAFGAHHRLVPYLAASPEVGNGPLEWVVLLAEDVFRRLDLDPAEVRACFHTYASFVLGSVIFEGTRRIANEKLAAETAAMRPRVAAASSPPKGLSSSSPLHEALLEAMNVSSTDPDLDEALFVRGVRQIVESALSGAARSE